MVPDRPVDNAPYFSHVHAGLTIEGYSRAAVQTLLAHPRAEDRLRPRRPAVGLHGHADLAHHAHATSTTSPPCRSTSPAGA